MKLTTKKVKKFIKSPGGLAIMAMVLAVAITLAVNDSVMYGTPGVYLPANIAQSSITLVVNGKSATNSNPLDIVTIQQAGPVGYPDYYAPVSAWTGGSWLSDVNGHYLGSIDAMPYNDGYYDAHFAVKSVNGQDIVVTEVIYRYILYETVAIGMRSGPKNPFNEPGYPEGSLHNYVSPMYSLMDSGYTGEVPFFSNGYGTYYMYINPNWSTQPATTYNDFKGALTCAGWADPNTWATPTSGFYQTTPMRSSNGQTQNIPNVDASMTYNDATRADVQTSLVPISFTCNGPFYNPVHSLTNAESNVANYASAYPVTATATVHVTANTQQLTSGAPSVITMPVQMADGSTQNLTFMSTAIQACAGFSGQDTGVIEGTGKGFVPTGAYSGLVPNINPAHNVPASFLDVAGAAAKMNAYDTGFSTSGTPGSQSNQPKISGSLVVTDASGTVTQLPGGVNGDNTAKAFSTSLPGSTVTATNNFTKAATPVVNAATIDAPYSTVFNGSVHGNCNTPPDLYISVTNTLGPRLTENIATANVNYETEHNSYVGYGSQQWYTDSHSTSIQWVYGASDDNYCSVQNFTFPLDCFVEKSIESFTSTGKPINISSIVDTDANAVYLDPNSSDKNVTYTPPNLDDPCEKATLFNPSDITTWGNIVYNIECWWNHYDYIVLGVVLVAAGLWVYSKVKK